MIDAVQGRDVALFEDNPYAELRYEGEALRSLLELDSPPDDGGHVMQAGTFSKTLMPGLRVEMCIRDRAKIKGIQSTSSKKRRKMSAEGRARISAAAKARWKKAKTAGKTTL